MRKQYREFLFKTLGAPEEPDDAFMAPADCLNVERAIVQTEVKCTEDQAAWTLTQLYPANEKDADAATAEGASTDPRRGGGGRGGRGRGSGGGSAGGSGRGRGRGGRAGGGDGADGAGAAAGAGTSGAPVARRPALYSLSALFSKTRTNFQNCISLTFTTAWFAAAFHSPDADGADKWSDKEKAQHWLRGRGYILTYRGRKAVLAAVRVFRRRLKLFDTSSEVYRGVRKQAITQGQLAFVLCKVRLGALVLCVFSCPPPPLPVSFCTPVVVLRYPFNLPYT